MTALFVYGSLMSPRVLAHVIGHPHDNTRKALAKGFRRFCIRDRSYPALCKTHDMTEVVQGVLVIGLGEKDVQALDEFEGSDYIRTAIKVKCEENDEEIEAYTYLWAKGDKDAELYGNWSFEKDFLPKEEETLRGWGFLH